MCKILVKIVSKKKTFSVQLYWARFWCNNRISCSCMIYEAGNPLIDEPFKFLGEGSSVISSEYNFFFLQHWYLQEFFFSPP